MLRSSWAIFQCSQTTNGSSHDFLPQRRRKPATEQALFHGLGVPQCAAVSTYHTVTLALIALSGTPRYGNRIKKIQTVERRRLDIAEAAPWVFFMGCSKCITELFYILQPPLYFRAMSLIFLPFRSELACLSAGGECFGDVAVRRRNLIWSLERKVGLSWRNILASSGLVNIKIVGWESWQHSFSQIVRYWEMGIFRTMASKLNFQTINWHANCPKLWYHKLFYCHLNCHCLCESRGTQLVSLILNWSSSKKGLFDCDEECPTQSQSHVNRVCSSINRHGLGNVPSRHAI